MRFRNRVQKYYIFLENTNYSVKKHLTYLFLLPIVLLSTPLYGETEFNHYAGVYGQLSEWSLMTDNKDYKLSAGFGGAVGGMYEIQLGEQYSPTRFLLNIGVGAQGGMTSFQQSSAMTHTLYNQWTVSEVHTPSKQFDYVYEIQNRHDWYRDISVGAPLMLGVQHKRFYMLAGVKVYYHLLTSTVSTATVSTYGQLPGLDPFRNMPEYQFFEGEKIKGDPVKTAFNLDVDVSMEIGGRIGYVPSAVGYDVPDRTIEYRLAVFVDYGLFDIRKNKNIYPGTGAAFDPANSLKTPDTYDSDVSSEGYVYKNANKTMLEGIVMNDIMSVDNFASRVNNLMVGLKFTVLFRLPKSGQCVTCRDNYLGTTRSKSRAGVQHEE